MSTRKTFIPKEKPLTARQESFCIEYVVDKNGTQAAIRAGYSKKTAASIATENLRKPNIVRRIDELLDEQRKKAELSAEIVVSELRQMGEYNVQDFLDKDNCIVDLTTLPRSHTKAIAGIKSKVTILPNGSKQVVTELKFVDRRASWVDLGRHVGIFEKDNSQRLPPPSHLTEDQFNKALKQARDSTTNKGK